MTNITALIDRLRAELDYIAGRDVAVFLTLDRKDAANLLRILEFVETMKIETMK